MSRSLRFSLVGSLLAAVLVVPACAPKRNVTVEQVPSLTKLDDLMDAQATIADPLFKKAGQTSFTDAELASFSDGAAKLQATALKAKDFSKGPAFDALAVQMHDRSADLATAAQGKDAPGTQKALLGIKATCKECHKKFR